MFCLIVYSVLDHRSAAQNLTYGLLHEAEPRNSNKNRGSAETHGRWDGNLNGRLKMASCVRNIRTKNY